ncbi:MAG: DNA polymerase III subunit gamma/tau [Desulfobacterales bacterium]
MSYLVLARKYRPQRFDEIVMQDHITRTLTNAIVSNRVAHAILFSGPRGTGKTTVARILAKAMNCKEGPIPVPCNVCRSCIEITAGNAVDVFEIDGASNNSVDQVRELRENAKYMPAHSLYKIYVIDEVHMLSLAAFNALLKTLEEPPQHVMFIFATTEPHKIPITILSRCQHHDFRRIGSEAIAMHLKTICSKENVDIAIESLRLIAHEAGGSMRDALSLLDQVMTCSDGALSHTQVLELLGVLDRKIIFDLSAAIFSNDTKGLLDMVEEIYASGHDMKKLYQDLIEHFRNLLVIKMGDKIERLVHLSADEIRSMSEQVKGVSEIFLNQVFNILFKEESTIRFAVQPKLAIEMILMKVIQIKPAVSIDILIEKLDNLRREIQGIGNQKNNLKKNSEPIKRQTELTPTPDDTIDEDDTWKKLKNLISEKNPSLAAFLKKCTLSKLTEDSLAIEANGNEFNLRMIQRRKNMQNLESICKDFFGKEMHLSIKAKASKPDERALKKNRTNDLKQKAIQHPLIADAVEIFNGKVVDIKLL